MGVLTVVWGSSLGWFSRAPPFSASSTHITYNVSDDFCRRILPNVRDDLLLSWKRTSCDDVRTSVRNSFDVWQHNSLVSFSETNEEADIVVRASTADDDDATTLGWAHVPTRRGTTLAVSIADTPCWYTDRRFCYTVRQHGTVVYSLMIIVWSFAAVGLLYVLFHPATTIVDGVARICAWSVFLGQPLVFFGALLPCTQCYDFDAVMMHEVGHSLGILHPDNEEGWYCGCGASRTSHCDRPNEKSVMQSVYEHRSVLCLSTDDVNAVRTLWGGSCTDPTWCYVTPSVEGLSRLSNAFVYAFGLAWLVVLVRNVCVRRRPRRTTPTPLPPPPHPSILPVTKRPSTSARLVRERGTPYVARGRGV